MSKEEGEKKLSLRLYIYFKRLFAGLCYLVYKDENWALNGALGVSASYVADIAVPAREKEKEEDY